MTRWRDLQSITVDDALRTAVGGHPLIAETLVRRGITTVAAAQRFLDPDGYTPADPYQLPDMDKAVQRVQCAIQQRETILVWGDFDVDGQTSTALLVSALRDLGAHVVYHVPNRFSEGHGIYLPTLKKMLDGGIDLLLTCDTGIAAHEAVAYAQGRGIDVVITDHHSLPDTLPQAHAAVNPMRLPEDHALRELPGVGTAYQLVRALYGAQSSDHLLDLVALGIVADVMVQVNDTRYWLQRGLNILRDAPRPSIAAMLARAEVDPANVDEQTIGFTLAPRLNALGRLADANPAVELLTSTDPALIAERITELEGLNQKRRLLTRQVYAAAQAQIAADPSLLEYAALVVEGDDWHTGVVGIVASRLAEDYRRPVLVLSQQGQRLSGSARSVAGANIVQAIRSQSELVTGFGGHNMAAGLSMPADNLFVFRRGISGVVRQMLAEVTTEPVLPVDAYLPLAQIDLAFAEDVGRLAPFGNGNPPLTLATRDVMLVSKRTLGSRGDHLELRVADASGTERRLLWWFGDVNAIPDGRFDIAYTVRANTFRGDRDALLEWVAVRTSESAPIALASGRNYDVVDYRAALEPVAKLAQLRTQYPDALVLSEHDRVVDGVNRYDVYPAETLIVWTAPPSVSDWDAITNSVQPQRVIVFDQDTKTYKAHELVQQLIGLLKYALRAKSAQLDSQLVAARTGHTEAAVVAGLRWINNSTRLKVEQQMDNRWQVEERPEAPATKASLQPLQRHLDEARAYHEFRSRQSF